MKCNVFNYDDGDDASGFMWDNTGVLRHVFVDHEHWHHINPNKYHQTRVVTLLSTRPSKASCIATTRCHRPATQATRRYGHPPPPHTLVLSVRATRASCLWHVSNPGTKPHQPAAASNAPQPPQGVYSHAGASCQYPHTILTAWKPSLVYLLPLTRPFATRSVTAWSTPTSALAPRPRCAFGLV